jgi:hypothetical protein
MVRTLAARSILNVEEPRLLPITYAIEGMRASLIGAAPCSALWRSLGPLMLFALIVLPLSLVSFHYATRHARITGTLAQY